MLQHQLRTFGDRSGHQEERGRRDIARHFNVGCGQLVAGFDRSGRAIDGDRVAEAAQHALGVVAGRSRLGHRGLAFGVQAGQQQAGLNLGTGHRHGVGQTLKLVATTDDHWRTAFRGGFDHGAHFTQWIGHAIHRALGQRSVAGQGAVEVLRSQQAGQQTHRRTGVAQVDRARCRLQAVQANAVNGHATVVRTFDHDAHVTERLQGRQGVFALEEAFDFGNAFGQGAEHDRTVGNRFVTWYANPTGQAATRLSQENQIVGIHSVHIGPAGQDFTEMLAGNPGASENAQQLVPIPCIDRVAQGVEIAAKCIECAQDSFAVGEEDVVPHDRVASGDSCEIAETARSVTEDLKIFIALGQ
ncbi:hypothetical protein D3C71_1030990 [compost metagenome]